MQNLKIYKVPIDSIKLNESNPRVILDDDFQNLVNSIKTDGFMLAIRFLVVDRDNIVLGGNQRLKACKVAGLSEVYVVKADELTEDQRKEFIVKDNLQYGEWDKEKMAKQYSTDELVSLGLDLIPVEQKMEFVGDIQPEIDKSDLQRRKDVYENNKIKQIVVYYPSNIYEKVIQSIGSIKKHMQIEETPELLLKLISYWKANYVS